MGNTRDGFKFAMLIAAFTFLFQTVVMALDQNQVLIRFLLFVPVEFTDGLFGLDVLLLMKALFNSVSYIFLHGSTSHLMGNMLFLIPACMGVIHFTGMKRGLFYYVFLGIGAALFFTLFHLNSKIPLLGASGAVYGMMGMFVAFRWKNMFSEIVTPLATMGAVFFTFKAVVEVMLAIGLTFAAKESGVAHLAHVGGFGAGLLLGLYHYKIHFRPWHKRI